MRRSVRVHDLQPWVEVDNGHVHEVGEELAVVRLIRQVAFEPGIIGAKLFDAEDRVALGPDSRQRSHPPQGGVRPVMREERDDEPDRQRDRDDGPGIHGPSIAYAPGGRASSVRQRRRWTEGCRRRSSVSNDRHGRVRRSHSAAG